MNEGFAREIIEVEIPGEVIPPVLHQNDIVQILKNKILLACNKYVMFRRLESNCNNGQVAGCPAVNSKWFEKTEAVTAHRALCFRNSKVYWNEKDRGVLWRAVSLWQIYSDNTTNQMKREAFLMK